MTNASFDNISVQNLMNVLGIDQSTMQHILERTKKMEGFPELLGIRETISQELFECYENLPENLEPEQIADTIVDVATAFVTACEEEITSEQMRDRIGSNCAELTDEQAIMYLSCLHIYLDQLDADSADCHGEAWLQKMIAKYEELTARGINTSAEDHIEALVRSIDEDKLNALFSFADSDELIGALKNGAIATSHHAAHELEKLFADVEDIAIFTTAVYIEHLTNGINGFSDNLSAGILTAHIAAAMNSARVAYAAANDQISPEEAAVKLNLIERAFAVAVALALCALLLIGSGLIAILLAAVLIELGAYALAGFAALLVIVGLCWDLADRYDGFKESIVDVLVELKTLTRPAVQKTKTVARNACKHAAAAVKKHISDNKPMMA